MMRPLIALFACFLISSDIAIAAVSQGNSTNPPGSPLFTSGSRLAEICDGKIGKDQPDTFAGGTCLGFISGTAEVFLLTGYVCYNNVTRLDLSDTVVRYMNSHPEELSKHTAYVIIGKALTAAYPVTAACRKEIGDTRPVP